MKLFYSIPRYSKFLVISLLLISFQNCGQKFSTPETKTENSSKNQETSSAPVSDRNPTSTPAPLPTPNPAPLVGNQPQPLPQIPNNSGSINPNQSGDTTVQSAAQYPADSHFSGVRWGGVFDPRVTGTAQFSPASWTDVTTYGQSQCITNNMLVTAGDGSKYVTIFWYFANNQLNANEALLPLRISAGESVAYKVILPPGTSESTVGDQASYWGNVWTQSTPRNSAPVYANGQSYGGVNPLVSYPTKNGFVVNPSFLISQPLSQENYAVIWFQHRGEGDNSVTAVKELTVNIKIKDINLYNQWIQRTAGIRCL